MAAIRPEPAVVLKAVDVYLSVAYDPPMPVAVRSQRAILSSFAGDFYSCPVIASDGKEPPRKYAMRLGNQSYPHMKLVIELGPDGKEYLFRADTHDRHCCPPPDHREYAAFVELMNRNQRVSSAIEAAWGEAGLPTFKTYLRDDLARRQAASAT